jgi:hypothetical protein
MKQMGICPGWGAEKKPHQQLYGTAPAWWCLGRSPRRWRENVTFPNIEAVIFNKDGTLKNSEKFLK